MRCRSAVAMVFCLGMVALLGVGASPAVAATCVDCHAAPPDGPPAPHGVLVAGVDCTTCHRGMSPHGTVFDPEDAVMAVDLTVGQRAGQLAGRLVVYLAPPPDRAWGIPDVVVYLQQRLWGATDYTDLGQVTTMARGDNLSNEGTYAFTIPSPVPWAAYRAIAQGDSEGWRVRKPQMAGWLPKPELKLTLNGLRGGVLPPERALTVSGTVAPTELAGKLVVVKMERKSAAGWKRYPGSSKSTISATGTYSCTVAPKHRGRFRIHGQIAATPDSTAITSAWHYFTVK